MHNITANVDEWNDQLITKMYISIFWTNCIDTHLNNVNRSSNQPLLRCAAHHQAGLHLTTTHHHHNNNSDAQHYGCKTTSRVFCISFYHSWLLDYVDNPIYHQHIFFYMASHNKLCSSVFIDILFKFWPNRIYTRG